MSSLLLDDFKLVTLDDKKNFDKHYEKYPPIHSDNVFTTIISWMEYSNYHYILKIVIIITITIITTDLFLVPYTLNLIFHIPIQILIFPRLVSAPVTIIIYTYILHIFNRRKVINIKYLENQSY